MIPRQFNATLLRCFDNGLLPWRLHWFISDGLIKVTFRSLVQTLAQGEVEFHRGWPPPPVEPDYAAAERFIRQAGVNVTVCPGDALVLSDTWINVPPPGTFDSRTDFFFTALQLLSRWAGERLDWSGHHLSAKLIAEIAASILCDEVGLVLPAEVGDRARLVKLWRHRWGQDNGLFFDGAVEAVRVVKYLESLGESSNG